jgi:hypothetical protein
MSYALEDVEDMVIVEVKSKIKSVQRGKKRSKSEKSEVKNKRNGYKVQKK